MKKYQGGLALLLLYAGYANALFCPTNFNQINIGDTPEQVLAQCGKATSEERISSDENQPQEWIYYLQDPGTLPLLNGQIQTYKFTFYFNNGMVYNITGNGTSLTETYLCNNVFIAVGNTKIQEVKAACGTPAMVTKSNTANENNPPILEKIIWKYEGSPSVTLIFENGRLKERL